MNIGSVMDELGDSLAPVAGLRTVPYYQSTISPPAAVVSWPEPYTFDETFGRGMDSFTFPVVVFVGKVDARSARDALSRYCDGSGDNSIKAAIETHTYTACDSVRVVRVEFGVIEVAGVQYLAATFLVNVVGSGA